MHSLGRLSEVVQSTKHLLCLGIVRLLMAVVFYSMIYFPGLDFNDSVPHYQTPESTGSIIHTTVLVNQLQKSVIILFIFFPENSSSIRVHIYFLLLPEHFRIGGV